MIYQLRLDCFFADHAPFDDLVGKLEDYKPDMIVVNPGQADQQCSVIDQIECHHDETPRIPCTFIDSWNNCP